MGCGLIVFPLVNVSSYDHHGIDSAICVYTAPKVMAEVTSSGTLKASQNYSLTCFADIPQSLNANITYVWTRGGTQVGTDSILDFSPLMLTNSGQYVCTVTVTSDLLSFPLTDESDVFEVTIQSEFLK